MTTPAVTDQTPVTPLSMPQTRQPAASPDEFFTAGQVKEMIDARARELQQAADARLSEATRPVQALQDELAQLREYQSQQQAAETARQKAIDDAQRRKDEDELSAKQLLAKYREESEERMRQMQDQLAARDALLAKEKELSALREYTSRRILEEGDAIMPQFADYIGIGITTAEDVDRNIEIAKRKTAAIVEEVKQAQIGQRAGMQPAGTGSGTYDYPGTAPGQAQQYTAEQIAQMVPGSPEHQAARQQFGLGGQVQANSNVSGFPTDPRMTAFG